MSSRTRDFGIVILLDALGTRQRILDDTDKYLADWNSVLNKLDENIHLLEYYFSSRGFRIGIKAKDIFDNIQIFYPTDDPRAQYIDLTGSNSIWWSLQHSAELLTNLVRYAITKNIFLRGCISMGYVQEFRNGYYSNAMVENADLAESFDMIGVIAGISSMRVLINKNYSSSPGFYHFIKYRIPIKEPTRKRRRLFDSLALVNLTTQSKMFDNIDDKEINDVIQEQIQIHHNDPTIRKKWENTKSFTSYVKDVSNDDFFL